MKLDYKLDRYSIVPLYYQLNEKILENIKKGELKPGDFLPAEEELCQKLDLSRGTVRQAINSLVEKGYVTRQRGKGTVIKSPTLNHDLIGDYSFGRGIQRLGLELSSKLIEVVVVNGKKGITNRLDLPNKAKVIKIARIRLANNEPWIIEESYLPANNFPGFENYDFEKNLISDVLLMKYHTSFSRIDAFVEPTIIDESHSMLLETKMGTPAMVMDRVLFDEKNIPTVYSHAYIRGDRCRYYFNITR